MLKVEFHSHSSDDPIDGIPYSTQDLIDRAAALGYDALAVTLHDRQLDIRLFESYAMQRRIVLIPGTERTIEGRHVLLLNFSHATEHVQSFEDLRGLKQQEPSGLVIAPHPFFPAGSALRRFATRYADLFDAVEYNAMFTTTLNFNEPAERWAREHGKPMVGNGDVHRLEQMGTTYSLVDAPRNAAAICEAVRAGDVKVVANPISWGFAARIIGSLYWAKYFDRTVRPAQPVQATA